MVRHHDTKQIHKKGIKRSFLRAANEKHTPVTYSRFHRPSSTISIIISFLTIKSIANLQSPIHSLANDLNLCIHIYFFHQSNQIDSDTGRACLLFRILFFSYFIRKIYIFIQSARAFLLFIEMHFLCGVGTEPKCLDFWVTPKTKYLWIKRAKPFQQYPWPLSRQLFELDSIEPCQSRENNTKHHQQTMNSNSKFKSVKKSMKTAGLDNKCPFYFKLLASSFGGQYNDTVPFNVLA